MSQDESGADSPGEEACLESRFLRPVESDDFQKLSMQIRQPLREGAIGVEPEGPTREPNHPALPSLLGEHGVTRAPTTGVEAEDGARDRSHCALPRDRPSGNHAVRRGTLFAELLHQLIGDVEVREDLLHVVVVFDQLEELQQGLGVLLSDRDRR